MKSLFLPPDYNILQVKELLKAFLIDAHLELKKSVQYCYHRGFLNQSALDRDKQQVVSVSLVQGMEAMYLLMVSIAFLRIQQSLSNICVLYAYKSLNITGEARNYLKKIT